MEFWNLGPIGQLWLTSLDGFRHLFRFLGRWNGDNLMIRGGGCQ
jgi:hypothetical protein